MGGIYVLTIGIEIKKSTCRCGMQGAVLGGVTLLLLHLGLCLN